MSHTVRERDSEIRVTLSEDLRRLVAANPGASLLMERRGGQYRSLEIDGGDIIFRRVAPDPNVATVSITIDTALTEETPDNP